MEKRYINESRYKKGTTRKRRDASTVKNKLTPQKEVKLKEKKHVKQTTQIKKKTKIVVKQNKLKNIIICIISLILIALISRAILKDENEPFIPLPFMIESNEEVIKIGVITEDSLLNGHTKNSVVNELNKYSKDMLLEVNEDYSITYKCISRVSKVSNKEYILHRNIECNVTANKIKEELDSYRNNKESVYYTKLQNIDSIQVVDANTLNVKLKTDSPYFIYHLDICLATAHDVTNYVIDTSSSENQLVYNRHVEANKELPAKVIVTKYKDVYAAAEAYKAKDINMFVTNAENVQNILGKHKYNIKTYRNGKTAFLFGNPSSELYKKEEVRKVIAYGIDRDSIIKDILKSKGDKLDLTYVYDNVKYKYDVYAAENLLLTRGYKKNNKVYSKTENGIKITLELDLLVNKEDEIKLSIANKIKDNLSAIGIKINVEKLKASQIISRIKKGTYDLILANVDLNNTPDISFVSDHLFITHNIKQAIESINTSTIQDLNKNVSKLQNALSTDVSTVGIYSDISYLVYNKDIIGINEISYMNLFKGILS